MKKIFKITKSFFDIIDTKQASKLRWLLKLKTNKLHLETIHIASVLLFLLCFTTNKVESVNYYFSTSVGNDTRTTQQAQSALTPWKTLSKLNSSMSVLLPGDSVLFKRGEVFYGSFAITKSGTAALPIIYAAYGTGANPVITGLTTLSGWTSKGTNLWEADCSAAGTAVNNLLINNVPQQIGRYPNVTDSNKGYLIFESHSSNTQITDNQLSSTPNWTGAEVVVRSRHWIIDRMPVKLHSGTTISFTGSTSYTPVNNWGYFFQNHPQTLDKYGEWYYNPSTKKVLLYTNSTNPSSSVVDVATVGTLVSISSIKYITLKNLVFKGANVAAINMSSAQYINVLNCSIMSSGVNGIVAINSSYIDVEDNVIRDSKNNALYFISNCSSNTLRNNVISNSGSVSGSGSSADDAYQALIIRGDYNVIEYNKIDSTGYVPIRYEGSGVMVKNNLIDYYCFTKDDGGAIYSWNGCSQTVLPKLSKVMNNIVVNGIGALEGTNYDYKSVYGIYMDDNTSNMEISGNTMANISDGAGLFLHDAHDMTITNNTIYNNGKQLSIQYDDYCPAGKIRNVAFNNNILFSKTSAQTIIDIYTPANDVSSFGVFDYNYYCRPANENSIIKVNSTSYALSKWQTTYAKDLNTSITPITLSDPANSIRFEYNGTKTAKVITLNDTYIDLKNNKYYYGTITLQPFTSIILLKKIILADAIVPLTRSTNFKVYPNPVFESFALEFDSPTDEIIHFELINVQGQKILVQDLPKETLLKQINLDKSTPNGMYVVVLSGENISETQKIIVRK